MGPTLETSTGAVREQVAEFTDRTGVEVDVEVIGWESLFDRIMTAVASGDGPDVLNIGNTWSATLQDTGAFLAFGPEELEAIGGEEKFIPSTLSATGAPGEPPASIPYLGQAYALYYRPDLLAEVGVTEVPDTWSELVRVAGRVSGRSADFGISLSAGAATGNAQLAYVLARQRGAEFVSDERPRVDDPAVATAVRELLDLMATGAVDPGDAEQTGITDSLDDLARGRAAFAPYQSSGRGYLASVDFDAYEVAPLPLPDPLPAGGRPVRGFVGGTNLAVFADTDRREDALALVAHLTDPDPQAMLNATFRTLPVVDAAYDDPAFDDEATQTFRDVLDDSEALPMVPGEAQMEQALGGAIADLFGRVALGDEVTDADIADALAAAQGSLAE